MANSGNIWQDIYDNVISFERQLRQQNFLIGVSFNLFTELNDLIAHRATINKNVVSVYWGKEITDIWLRQNYPLQPEAVFIDVNYSSYLNLVEIAEETAKYNHNTKVIDFITDSTNLKEGEDLDDWLTYNEPFKDALVELWEDEVVEIWLMQGRMNQYREGVDFSNYWNYEDYIKTITVYDYELNPIVIFITGTYADYV